jgi:hypothetical protein
MLPGCSRYRRSCCCRLCLCNSCLCCLLLQQDNRSIRAVAAAVLGIGVCRSCCSLSQQSCSSCSLSQQSCSSSCLQALALVLQQQLLLCVLVLQVMQLVFKPLYCRTHICFCRCSCRLLLLQLVPCFSRNNASSCLLLLCGALCCGLLQHSDIVVLLQQR